MKKHVWLVLPVAIVAALVIPPAIVSSDDEEPKGPNQSGPEEKGSSDSASVRDLRLAEELAAWGREHQHAAALALAARIRGDIEEKPMEGVPPKESQGGKNGEAQEPAHLATAPELLEEAKKLAGEEHQGVIDAIGRMGSASRGSPGGAKTVYDVVAAGDTDIWTITFRGSETAEVLLIGDGRCDLDLVILDENKNVIRQDTDGTDRCYLRWVPRWTGLFYIAVKNCTGRPAAYGLATN